MNIRFYPAEYDNGISALTSVEQTILYQALEHISGLHFQEFSQHYNAKIEYIDPIEQYPGNEVARLLFQVQHLTCCINVLSSIEVTDQPWELIITYVYK